MVKLEMQVQDVIAFDNSLKDTADQIRLDAMKKRERQKDMGMGGQLEYMNEVNWPLAKIKNRSFLIDMLFELNDEDEVSLLWCQGVVTQLLTKPINNNIKPINVMVK